MSRSSPEVRATGSERRGARPSGSPAAGGAPPARGKPAIGPIRSPNTSGISEHELGPGLRAIVARRTSVPLVELRLGFPLPADLIRRPETPLVMSAAMLSGTAEHDRASLAAAVQDLGGTLDVGANDDWMRISASVLKENLVPMLRLVCGVLAGATYPGAEVAADRARLADEIVMTLSQPEVVADERLRRRLHKGHPYAAGLPSPAAVRRVASPALRRSHAEVVHPWHAHLVLVGDVPATRGLSLVADALGSWFDRAGEPNEDGLDPLPPIATGPVILVDRPGAVQSNIRLGRLAPGRRDASWPATALANLIFGGLFSSRLVDNLRERRGYSYSPRSSIDHGRAGSTFEVSADVATPSTAAALAEIRYELARMATTGTTAEELQTAQRYGLGTLSYGTASQSGLASTLSNLAAGGMDPGYLSRHPAALRRVTVRQVNEAAEELLAPSRLVTVVVGDHSAVERPLAMLDSLQLEASDQVSSGRSVRS